MWFNILLMAAFYKVNRKTNNNDVLCTIQYIDCRLVTLSQETDNQGLDNPMQIFELSLIPYFRLISLETVLNLLVM